LCRVCLRDRGGSREDCHQERHAPNQSIVHGRSFLPMQENFRAATPKDSDLVLDAEEKSESPECGNSLAKRARTLGRFRGRHFWRRSLLFCVTCGAMNSLLDIAQGRIPRDDSARRSSVADHFEIVDGELLESGTGARRGASCGTLHPVP